MTSEPAEHDPFFEPAPASEDPAPARRYEMQPWDGPSPVEAGVFLAVGQTLARSAKAVVFLPVIRVFSSGCLLDVEIVSRPSAWPEDDPWDMQLALHRSFRGFRGSRLPDVVLRLGVRFADGCKATTIEDRRRGLRDDAPDGPLAAAAARPAYYWPEDQPTVSGSLPVPPSR